MNLIPFFRSTSRMLGRNKMRGLIMMAGVTVGIASLTILTAIGEGTRRETMKRFKNMLGTFDTILVRPGAGKNRGMVSLTNVDPTLKFEDADAIAQIAEIRQVAEVENAFEIDVKYRDRDETPGIFGVTSNWLELRGDEVAQGSFFSEQDNRALARVAVLGSDARKRLFADEDPTGKTIRIGEVPFVVSGVMAARGAGPAGGSLDNLIFIPVNTASKRLFNRDFLTMLIVQLRDPADPQPAVHHVEALLRARHHLTGSALDDFNLTNPQAVMRQVASLGSTLERLLLIVALLATGIGGIVVMSVTLIGVSERRNEIGIRRAVGATRLAIMLQFLLEAILVSAAGGLAGVGIGIGGTQLVSRWQHLPFLIQQRAVAFSLALSIGLGLVFGIYPAWKAARTNPADAVRG